MSDKLSEIERKIALVSDLYARNCQIERDPDWFLLKLQEEIGELVSAHLIRTSRSRKKMSDHESLRGLQDELADVFAMTLLYARNQNIDLVQALEQKWFNWLKEPPKNDDPIS